MVGHGFDLGTCKNVCKTIYCKTWIFCNLENLDFLQPRTGNCFLNYLFSIVSLLSK